MRNFPPLQQWAGLSEAAQSEPPPETSVETGEQTLRLTAVPVKQIMLVDLRAEGILREFTENTPQAMLVCAPDVIRLPGSWQERLLRSLDEMPTAVSQATAVVFADSVSDSDVNEVARVARLHPETPIFMHAASDVGATMAASYGLHLFEPGLLVGGEIPEDSWTRVARLWHECYRLSHPVPPGSPKAAARRPWAELAPYLRQDNLLQIRSVLSAVAELGRRWIPVHMAPRGSIIELSDQEVDLVASREHARWLERRTPTDRRFSRKLGWLSSRKASDQDGILMPWADLSSDMKAVNCDFVRSEIAQLEDVGFLPAVPIGGPPEAATFQRTGIVSATRLAEGNWRVNDSDGNVQTITNDEFRSSYQKIGDGRFRRIGICRAWQVAQQVTIRTTAGRMIAYPGDWVVEDVKGRRTPVSDLEFRRSHQPRA